MRNLFLFSLILSLILPACQTASEAGTSEVVMPTATFPPIDEEAIARALQFGRLGDSLEFPFVYAGENRTVLFEAYTMRFQLTYDEALYPETNSGVPWLKQDVYSEQSGVFATFLRNGRDLSMQSPYILVQWIRNDQAYTSTIDSIYVWLDDTFTGRRPGKVMKDLYRVPTSIGKDAICKHYLIDTDTEKNISGKKIAYAYLPYDHEYFIGFALTTYESGDFGENIDLFHNLVSSFQYF